MEPIKTEGTDIMSSDKIYTATSSEGGSSSYTNTRIFFDSRPIKRNRAALLAEIEHLEGHLDRALDGIGREKTLKEFWEKSSDRWMYFCVCMLLLNAYFLAVIVYLAIQAYSLS